ncbi:Uncharacterised protein [Mycobacteroides abscessus subsp. abscessus]|nr:Uncharacterised protein [Mycobacteroides abscessus subsp. abscessus]
MHRNEICPTQKFVECQQFDTELGGTSGRDIGVVRDDVRAERGEPLREQLPDAAQAHNADGLAEYLGAVERRALPGVRLERGVSRRDLPRGGQQQGHGVLGRAVDVRGGGIDHQNTTGSGSLDVDIVESDAGTRDDLELGSGGQHLGVNRGGRAHQKRISLGYRSQQRGAVRAIDPAHLHTISECFDGRRGKFVGNQHDWTFAHVVTA